MTRFLIFLLSAVWPAAAGLRPAIEYGRDGATPLTMDAFVPNGKGPAATVVVEPPEATEPLSPQAVAAPSTTAAATRARSSPAA